ncbi:hypothetical protein [Flaviflagellibacter deserti]|uniref:Uncharacterized protein n=1 Tax=Flaviflagellibacter deserti TaxID=2267266 RepID=A0ABV9YYJ3_9HYPH
MESGDECFGREDCLESTRLHEWQLLFDSIQLYFSNRGYDEDQDYWILEDDYGFPSQQIVVSNLFLLQPTIMQGLRKLLDLFPEWQIFVGVDVSQHGELSAPEMGLILRRHEVIDGLQRAWLPLEFRELMYEDSRPGTVMD